MSDTDHSTKDANPDVEPPLVTRLQFPRAGSRHEAGRIVVGNEFSIIEIERVETRNGTRLLIHAPKSGQWITLDPLELEALTWQNDATISAMVGHPFAPLIEDER